MTKKSKISKKPKKAVRGQLKGLMIQCLWHYCARMCLGYVCGMVHQFQLVVCVYNNMVPSICLGDRIMFVYCLLFGCWCIGVWVIVCGWAGLLCRIPWSIYVCERCVSVCDAYFCVMYVLCQIFVLGRLMVKDVVLVLSVCVCLCRPLASFFFVCVVDWLTAKNFFYKRGYKHLFLYIFLMCFYFYMYKKILLPPYTLQSAKYVVLFVNLW